MNGRAVGIFISAGCFIGSGLISTGLEQLIKLSTGTILLCLATVLAELSRWRRM
jgi:hypothetical protein